jgi:Ca2+-binding RTX toxin-like protein
MVEIVMVSFVDPGFDIGLLFNSNQKYLGLNEDGKLTFSWKSLVTDGDYNEETEALEISLKNGATVKDGVYSGQISRLHGAIAIDGEKTFIDIRFSKAVYVEDIASFMKGGTASLELFFSKNDQLVGQSNGYAGHDYMFSTGGTVHGGTGNDVLFSSDRADILHGDQGGDTIFIRGDMGAVVDLLDQSNNAGAAAGDRYFSFEQLNATPFADKLIGSNNADRLSSGAGADTIYANGGDDGVGGSNGKDTIYGGSGNDYIAGGSGKDWLFGDDGDDELYGGSYADVIRGGFGADTLRGGGGDDIFVFKGASASTKTSTDMIRDFRHGYDTIDVSGINANIKRAGNNQFELVSGKGPLKIGELHFWDENGSTILAADVDGDKAADFYLVFYSKVKLDTADFIL